MKEIFSLIYQINFENGLTEWELDHVFVGYYDGKIHPNPKEIEEVKWINMKDLKKEIEKNPEKFTPWFRLILERTDFLNNINIS